MATHETADFIEQLRLPSIEHRSPPNKPICSYQGESKTSWSMIGCVSEQRVTLLAALKLLNLEVLKLIRV